MNIGDHIIAKYSRTVLRITGVRKVKKQIEYDAEWISGGCPKEWYPKVIPLDDQVIGELFEIFSPG